MHMTLYTPPLHVYSFIHDAYSSIVCLTYAWYVCTEKAGVKIPVVHLECLRAYEEKTKTKADVADPEGAGLWLVLLPCTRDMLTCF